MKIAPILILLLCTLCLFVFGCETPPYSGPIMHTDLPVPHWTNTIPTTVK